MNTRVSPAHDGPKRVVTFILTRVPFYETWRILAHVKDVIRRQPKGGASAVPAGGFVTALPGGLGIMSPGIMTGVGGASLDWDRRRRVTPVQTASQEAWPEAEPLGWNNSLR